MYTVMQKAALSGDLSVKSPNLERFFGFARTHFGAKDWAAQAQPQRLCGQARTRPTRKTLCIFEISPRRSLLF
jgi:hypothetical protein